MLALLAATLLGGGPAWCQEPDRPPAAEARTGAEPPVEAEAPDELPAPPPTGQPTPEETPAEPPSAAVPEEDPLAAVPPPDRITFELPFPEDEGGGVARGSAAALEYERAGHAVATGGVEVRYQDYEFRADRVAIDLESKQIEAQGNVIVDQGPRRLAGETLTWDLESETGRLTEASAFLEPDMSFQGAEVAKVGDDTYTVIDGMFTSCLAEVPEWSFRLGRARVEVEGYARVRDARMRVKRMPILYVPYILWPAKTERASGLLVPNVGYTRRRGAYLGLAYFQVLGPSYDTTLFLDLYGEEFVGLGDEFRYHPSEGTKGLAQGYLIEDPLQDETRWKLRWDHETQNLPWDMRGVIAYREFSDFEFFRDFEREFDDISLRSIHSSGFATGNWGHHSLNLLVDDRQTFIGGDIIRQRQLPEVEYRLRPSRLGRLPLYLALLSSLNYFDVERSATYDGSYGRADLAPELTLPIRTVPWLSASLSAGGRLTWYQDSLDSTGSAFSGESLTRTLPVAGAELVGPSFSRIFDRRIAGFNRFKHVIEPRWTYSFLGDIDDQDLIPLFDEVDSVRAVNLGTIALVSRLLAKPADPEAGGAREVLSFELARSLSFDADQPLQVSSDQALRDDWGPLTSRLRFNPTAEVSVQGQLAFNTLFDQLEATSVSGSYAHGPTNVGVTWFTRFDPEIGNTRSDQVRIFSGFDVLPARLRLESQVNYDLEQSLLQQQRHMILWNSQCYSLRLEVREFKTVDRLDRDFRFAVTLKNVGTFLDLTGGRSERF